VSRVGRNYRPTGDEAGNGDSLADLRPVKQLVRGVAGRSRYLRRGLTAGLSIEGRQAAELHDLDAATVVTGESVGSISRREIAKLEGSNPHPRRENEILFSAYR
jgi:hypothetical protein